MESKSTARKPRKNLTDAERKLWSVLKSRRLEGFKFRRQVPIGRYVVDFICYEKRLIIEVDGGHHMEQENEDLRRTAWLESQGHRVIRFWNDQVLKESEAVIRVIVNELKEGQDIPPHPSPFPQGGEGVIKEKRKCRKTRE